MTENLDRVLSRRSAFAALGATTLVAASGAAAQAATMSTVEEANLKLCEAAIASRSGDGQKLAGYLADDCVLRLEDAKQTIVGKQNISSVFQDFSALAEMTAKTQGSLAKGSLVVIHRNDTILYKDAAAPAKTFVVAGVFTVEGGKIQQWVDVVVDTKTVGV